MADLKHSDEVQQKLSLFDKIIAMFKRGSQSADHLDREIHLEPKYWPEVKEFIDNLNAIIDNHTIVDSNIHRVNERIVEYILEQINKKGQIEDVEQRYSALRTLSDRILSHHLNKVVGLKESTNSNTDFSDAVHSFQVKLELRHQQELDTNKEQSSQI